MPPTDLAENAEAPSGSQASRQQQDSPSSSSSSTSGGNSPSSSSSSTSQDEQIPETSDDPAPPEPASTGVQVARPVPGKPGYVFSPFNSKVIDVKGIPSGTLVADPSYPAAEKKYFRVP